jgi:hypothetical protein
VDRAETNHKVIGRRGQIGHARNMGRYEQHFHVVNSASSPQAKIYGGERLLEQSALRAPLQSQIELRDRSRDQPPRHRCTLGMR